MSTYMKVIFVADDPWPWPVVVPSGRDKPSDDQVQSIALEGLWVS